MMDSAQKDEKKKRYAWIKQWISEHGPVDMIDADFVANYISEFNAAYIETSLGAHKCKQLSMDLSAMHNNQTLQRHACGLPAGYASMGFPKWVYSYELKDQGESYV